MYKHYYQFLGCVDIMLPIWFVLRFQMMENLLLQEGDIVKVRNTSLAKGSYVRLQPHTKDFLDISNPKAMFVNHPGIFFLWSTCKNDYFFSFVCQHSFFMFTCSLETSLRSYSCLTTGDTIMVPYNNKKYYIDIVETKPSSAVSIIETDCEVDFAPPLDYKEPEKPTSSSLSNRTRPEGIFPRKKNVAFDI